MRLSKPILFEAAVFAGALLLSGCATGMKGSARRICYDSGLQPGTHEFANCWQGIAHRDLNNATEAMVGGAVAGAIVSGNIAPAPAYAPAPRAPYWSRPQQLVREWFAPSADRMCQYANGSVLNVGSRSCPASIEGR